MSWLSRISISKIPIRTKLCGQYVPHQPAIPATAAANSHYFKRTNNIVPYSLLKLRMLKRCNFFADSPFLKIIFVAVNVMIDRVSFDRLPPRFYNQLPNLVNGQ